ncbi:hypothetical protein C8J56DRAFT_1056331 [Mycena floridula]|nr:hypothetical protein C8J56DRAFT_1056331 [Mycena floridula]
MFKLLTVLSAILLVYAPIRTEAAPIIDLYNVGLMTAGRDIGATQYAERQGSCIFRRSIEPEVKCDDADDAVVPAASELEGD